MASAKWYVIQVETGRELVACKVVKRACRMAEEVELASGNEDQAPVLDGCFAPRYRTQYKLHGEWHPEERLVLPGYVVAVTESPGKLAQVLRSIPKFARLLAMGETFVPLSKEDKSWLERWMGTSDHVIPMSVAHKEGDAFVVTEGPLKGHEAKILKVIRRRSIAEVEVSAGPLRIKTTVGLAVLPKPEG